MSAQTKRLVVLLSGRGSNLGAILRHTRAGVLAGVAEVVLVVSNDPQAGGLELARAAGVQTAVVPHGRSRSRFEEALVQAIRPHAPDLVVLAGFMRRLSPRFISVFRGRIVNIHPADTRCHQGLHGYAWAFDARLSETFVTVHEVDEGLDTGRVLGRAPVDLRGAVTLAEVEARGLAVEHEFYSAVIRRVLEAQSQDGTGGTGEG